MQTSPPATAVARLRTSVTRTGTLPARALLAVDRRRDVGRRRSWRHVTDELLRLPAARISVDVFDTVLTRRVVGDGALWWLTAQELLAIGGWSGTAQEFVTARRAAAAAGPEDDLRRMYRRVELAARLHTDEGADVEARLEAELAVPVHGAGDALARLRAVGHRVVFVSDMHLSHDALWRSLVAHGLAVDGDELVVSTDVGASKSAGTLFPLLASRPDPPSWHVGNDLWSDVAMAERAGVRALPVRVAESSRLERLMAGHVGSVGAAVAGAARQVRIAGEAGSPSAAALCEVGADVAGQCLTAFLLWAREECERAGVEQLCFLARDGELPLRMAEAMPPDHWEGVRLQYLHGSRRLWSAASLAVVGLEAWLTAGTNDDAGFLRQNQHAIPWGSLLARALLVPEDLQGRPDLAALPLDEPLPERLDDAWRALLADDGVRARLLERAQLQLAHLQELLRGQGIGTSRVGLVDVGWRGQLAAQVSAVLRSVTGHEPVHLHFGGVDVADEVAADIRRFAVDDSRAPLPFPDIVSCVETMTASGAARARSTERGERGDVRLVFDPPLPDMDTEHRRLLWRSAVDVARSLPSREALRRWDLRFDGLDLLTSEVLTAFWLSPSSEHARAAAHLASEVDDAGHSVVPVARPYSLADLRNADVPSRTWRQGSVALMPGPLRLLLHWAFVLRDRRALVQSPRGAPVRPSG